MKFIIYFLVILLAIFLIGLVVQLNVYGCRCVIEGGVNCFDCGVYGAGNFLAKATLGVLALAVTSLTLLVWIGLPVLGLCLILMGINKLLGKNGRDKKEQKDINI